MLRYLVSYSSLLRSPNCPYRFAENLDRVLLQGRAAYRVLDGRTIVPIASEAERATLKRAFSDLAASEFRGARSHLHTAGAELTAGNYASSIRESIHAVESVRSGLLRHPASSVRLLLSWRGLFPFIADFKSGLLSIYGYTSNRQRHSPSALGRPAG